MLWHVNVVCWQGWGDKSYSRNNTITANNIHHVLCGGPAGLAHAEQLVDGGALYSLGAQPGSTRSYNYLHHSADRSECCTTTRRALGSMTTTT